MDKMQRMIQGLLADRGHKAVTDHYWAVGRGWSWAEEVPSGLRQCEIDAVAGSQYLCLLVRKRHPDVPLPADPDCVYCQRHADIIKET